MIQKQTEEEDQPGLSSTHGIVYLSRDCLLVTAVSTSYGSVRTVYLSWYRPLVMVLSTSQICCLLVMVPSTSLSTIY